MHNINADVFNEINSWVQKSFRAICSTSIYICVNDDDNKWKNEYTLYICVNDDDKKLIYTNVYFCVGDDDEWTKKIDIHQCTLQLTTTI